MKRLLIATIVFAASTAFAQAPQGPPAQVPPQLTAQDLENQMQEVGCKAERQAAAQTIMQLRQQNSDLQKQISKLDPPAKSGATKH